ncbi:hypothetical protein NEDG_02218 [Nematocida displodere]|uniref:RING-type domain-containing protein n=1 Tax=Nematocida displodere TaxID=1805483 RepID=A0A177EFM5_9MICR|nr:hypothetical protein NEDG_02218 [Nematocida displodere]
MGSKLINCFRKVFKNGLRWALFGLIVLGVDVGCSDVSSGTDHIVSPYTEQTMRFFERSGFKGFPNQLETIQIVKERHIHKKQRKRMNIYFHKYTLDTVPDQLVQGLEFDNLRILTPTNRDTPNSPAVLEKILCALGRISAETLAFHNQTTNTGPSDPNAALQPFEWSLAHHNGSETMAPLTRCVLKVEKLMIFSNTVPLLKWIQDRLDLSESRAELSLFGELELDNLEVLDGFNARGVGVLTLASFKRLDSLDCKLLREGPLPDELIIWGRSTLAPKVSEEVAQNMLTKVWLNLAISMEVWVELVKPGELPKHLTAEYLTLKLCAGSSITALVMGMNRATVWGLSIVFTNENNLLTSSDIEQTLDWISTGFDGLVSLSVRARDVPPALTDFVRSNTFEITTNPTLTSIWVCGIECRHIPSIISGGSNIVCFSLDAWELYRSGKLADELANSQTDLSRLPVKQRAIVMNREELGADNEPCCVCYEPFEDLKATRQNTDICILDHPKHSVCCSCLDKLIKNGRNAGYISCPKCRQEHRLSLIRHKINLKNQGGFRLTVGIPPSALSFPRTHQTTY